MKFWYWLYRWGSALLYLTLFPLFRMFLEVYGALYTRNSQPPAPASGWRRYRLGLEQRQGHYPFCTRYHVQPRLWLHAASVGEVGVAATIIRHIERSVPRCSLYLSSTTVAGLDAARQHFGDRYPCFLAPLDTMEAVERALRTIQPRALVCVETELWPHWLIRARQRGANVLLVNGRISARSCEMYLKFPPLLAFVLQHLQAFSMISAADARRIIRLGAPAQYVVVNGNAKYDTLATPPPQATSHILARQMGLTGRHRVWVAGSTRQAEEVLLLEAFKVLRHQFHNLVLILAPRHIQRIPEISRRVARQGWRWSFRSQPAPATPDVILLDTLGELPAVYGLSEVAFCGGSLVPMGGQNLLEAAVWGIPVLYGPFMDDFMTEKALLEDSGGGIEVGDQQQLVATLRRLLSNPAQAAALGARGRQAVLQNQGAATRHAAVIARFIKENQTNQK